VARVGISACLLGRAVRWDGGHKLRATIVEDLGREVDLCPVCPEVEIGLGVPRSPIELFRNGGRVGLRVVAGGAAADPESTETALGDRMRRFADRHLAGLLAGGLSGFVLKSRSPSCGLAVPVAGDPEDLAPGLFAGRVRSLAPDLPVVEDEDLASPEARGEFLARVRDYDRSRGGGRLPG
jgi:uncharacterized protein YbbK (DUF523 family)